MISPPTVAHYTIFKIIVKQYVRIYGVRFYPWDNCPSPPMRAVISSIFSNGNGGWESGFIAIDISFMGLSSAATRFELKCPHLLHRWMIAHSPFFLTQTPTGSMIPPQSASRSPGSMSKCRLLRQFGPLRWARLICRIPYRWSCRCTHVFYSTLFHTACAYFLCS